MKILLCEERREIFNRPAISIRAPPTNVSQKIPKEILMRHLVLAILAPGPLTPLIQVKGRTLSKQTRQDAVNAALGNAIG
jgi:hypothetical protein